MRSRKFYALALLALLLIGIVPSVAAQQATNCEAGFRLIVHAMGETCVPEAAERIVTIGPSATEFAYLAGKNIIGTPQHILDELIYVNPQLEAAFEDITIVGWPPNPEVILGLQPDLIIGHAVDANMQIYEELQAIAPTVIQPLEENLDWKSAATYWSNVLAAEDVYDELLAAYDSRIETLRDILAENSDTREVSILVASDPNFTFTRLPNSDVGTILADAGINRPEIQSEPNEFGYLQITLETLDLADGDLIFLFGYTYTDTEAAALQNTYIDELVENPLWLTLSAVQNDQVIRVSEYWYRGGSYTFAVHQVIDDLFTHLAGVDPQEVSPNPYPVTDTVAED